MKKIIYSLIVTLIVLSVFAFANRAIKNETSEKSIPKTQSADERKAGMEQWEATPEGVMYKKWEKSPAGKKVFAAAAKINKAVNDSSNMEGVITSLSLPPGSRLGFGLMVRINDDEYILAFGPEKYEKNIINEFEQLHSLRVNDKIIIRSNSVSHTPKYSYPIVTGDYVERDCKIIYKRTPRIGGC